MIKGPFNKQSKWIQIVFHKLICKMKRPNTIYMETFVNLIQKPILTWNRTTKIQYAKKHRLYTLKGSHIFTTIKHQNLTLFKLWFHSSTTISAKNQICRIKILLFLNLCVFHLWQDKSSQFSLTLTLRSNFCQTLDQKKFLCFKSQIQVTLS